MRRVPHQDRPPSPPFPPHPQSEHREKKPLFHFTNQLPHSLNPALPKPPINLPLYGLLILASHPPPIHLLTDLLDVRKPHHGRDVNLVSVVPGTETRQQATASRD